MKPLEPFRPEPRRRKRGELWFVTFWLALMIAGAGIGLYCFRESGAIGDTQFWALIALLVTVSASIFIVLDIERSINDAASPDAREVPAPFDIHKVWPPSEAGKENSAALWFPAHRKGDHS
ncbi:MAG TPA: hypothetical protein VF503_06280 [Sphingobium sp.]|uniref:hypothetical protein n=1 Tax=Sphingobium sp. TaxID=1912891 RepID=UPI002ED5E227